MFTPGTVTRKNGIGTLSSLTEVLRDTKPLHLKKNISDPVVINVQQIIDIHEYEKEGWFINH